MYISTHEHSIASYLKLSSYVTIYYMILFHFNVENYFALWFYMITQYKLSEYMPDRNATKNAR